MTKVMYEGQVVGRTKMSTDKYTKTEIVNHVYGLHPVNGYLTEDDMARLNTMFFIEEKPGVVRNFYGVPILDLDNITVEA